jgi:hypothetical protein
LPPINLGRDDRFRSLPEAFVIGGIRLGEKQEQSKNKIALNGKIHARDGAGAPPLDHRAIRRRRHRERSDAIQGNVEPDDPWIASSP